MPVVTECVPVPNILRLFRNKYMPLLHHLSTGGKYMAENREVKSDVFSMLMEDKNNALEVYNALNNSNYQDAELVEMKTLEKGISLTIRNDAAFIVGMDLNIYEHQSTYSPNIPLRLLIYLTELIKPIVKDRNLYGRTKVSIPVPRFAVFYNGSESRPAVEILKLSDLFEKKIENPEIELICTVYNINHDTNHEKNHDNDSDREYGTNSDKGTDILGRCSVLNEYMTFIDKIRACESSDIDSPIATAIDWCIANHILEDFLRERRPEVLKAMTLDMTFEHREEMTRRDALEEGRREGKEEGLKEGIKEGIKEGKSALILDAFANGRTPEQIAEFLAIPLQEILDIQAQSLSAKAQ